MKRLLLALLLASPIALTLPVHAGTLYHAGTPLNTGQPGTSSIALADLNGDGRLDVVTANGVAPNVNSVVGSISVLLGNGNGTFQPAVTYVSGGRFALSVAVADLNGDGKPDVVVANRDNGNLQGTVGVLLGNGDGTFQPVVTYSSGGLFATSVVVADLNGDGKPDLVIGNEENEAATAAGIGVLLGNGDGTFQSAVVYPASLSSCCGLAVADLNNDGKLDVLVAGGNGSCPKTVLPCGFVAVLLGNGDGTLQSAVNYASGGLGATAVAVADLNGDGKPDLAVANTQFSSDSCCIGGVGVLLGNGDGTFRSATSYLSGGGFSDAIAVVDVHGDGKLSIVVANGNVVSNKGSIATLLSNGDGTFQGATGASIYNSGGHSATSLAVADVNRDGRPDILAANWCAATSNCNVASGTGSVSVFLRTPLATTMKLTTSGSPSHLNQAVTFTATITSKSPVQDGQTVTFYDGGTRIGTGTTVSGVAAFTTSSLSVKTHTIKATYPGNFDFKASLGTVQQVVSP